jgi:multidrug efflux pump subunit AcrA (membrane-fusion protein)
MKINRSVPGILFMAVLLSWLPACNSAPADSPAESGPRPRTQVGFTYVQIRDLRQEERFPATAFYPESNKLAAPIAGYILSSPGQAGESVRKGQKLFHLETKEHRAISEDPELKDSDLAKMGTVTVSAPAAGMLLTLDQREGDFVSEGTTLCTIAISEQIRFRLNVPYEYNQYVRPGLGCTIELPDDTRLKGRIEDYISGSGVTAQTLTFSVRPLAPTSVPDGLNVVVLLQTARADQAMIVPQDAILANETLDRFWVMLLSNDSTAVKVPVITGLSTGDSIQIVSPPFTAADRILTTGNYGLEDTAFVNINSADQ